VTGDELMERLSDCVSVKLEDSTLTRLDERCLSKTVFTTGFVDLVTEVTELWTRPRSEGYIRDGVETMAARRMRTPNASNEKMAGRSNARSSCHIDRSGCEPVTEHCRVRSLLID
jgi:hypothetical protein